MGQIVSVNIFFFCKIFAFLPKKRKGFGFLFCQRQEPSKKEILFDRHYCCGLFEISDWAQVVACEKRVADLRTLLAEAMRDLERAKARVTEKEEKGWCAADAVWRKMDHLLWFGSSRGDQAESGDKVEN